MRASPRVRTRLTSLRLTHSFQAWRTQTSWRHPASLKQIQSYQGQCCLLSLSSLDNRAHHLLRRITGRQVRMTRVKVYKHMLITPGLTTFISATLPSSSSPMSSVPSFHYRKIRLQLRIKMASNPSLLKAVASPLQGPAGIRNPPYAVELAGLPAPLHAGQGHLSCQLPLATPLSRG